MSKTFNLEIRIPNSDIIINNIDMNFNIKKNNKPENNTAEIVLWNISDTNFYNLNSSSELEFYAGYDNLILAFKGGVKSVYKKAVDCDIAVVVELADGLSAYRDVKMNIDYRSNVSSVRIIRDCITAMGLKISKMSENLPQKTYSTYKAFGNPQTILERITKPLGIICSVQNGTVHLICENDNPETENLQVLDKTTSLPPDKSSDGTVEINSKFLPALNPNDYVECKFDGFEGVNRVEGVHSFGNNYGNAATTIVRLGWRKTATTA